MKTVTITKLRALLAGITHATPIGLVVMTDARPRKTGLPFKAVRKLTRLNVMVGAFHEAAVRRQQEREGNEATFEAKPRQWGVAIPGTCLIQHGDAFYLSAQMNPAFRPRPMYLVPQGTGRRAGKLRMVPKWMVDPWLPEERDERDYQGVARPVTHRDFRLENIVQLTLNGEQCRVRGF